MKSSERSSSLQKNFITKRLWQFWKSYGKGQLKREEESTHPHEEKLPFGARNKVCKEGLEIKLLMKLFRM